MDRDADQFVSNYLTCPITHEIFHTPVTASDGFTYERAAIEEHYSNNKTSPMTRVELDGNFVVSMMCKQMVEQYLEVHPEKKDEQYKPSPLKLTDDAVIRIILGNMWTELLRYSSFRNTRLLDIFERCKDEKFIKHIIDNFEDIEESDELDQRLIHFVCRYSSPKMIRYIIDKGVNLEVKTNGNWYPIHFICKHSTPEMIRYIIDKGVNLEVKTNGNWRPIHVICRYSTPEMIRYIIDKGVSLLCRTTKCDGNDSSYNPIDLIDLYNNNIDEKEKRTLKIYMYGKMIEQIKQIEDKCQ